MNGIALIQYQRNAEITYPVKLVGINTDKIISLEQRTVTYRGTATFVTLIKYMVGDGSNPDEIYVSQKASDIKASVNTANTSNSIKEVTITRKNDDSTTTILYQPIAQISTFYNHPDSAADTLMITEDVLLTRNFFYKADETVSAIVALMNA